MKHFQLENEAIMSLVNQIDYKDRYLDTDSNPKVNVPLHLINDSDAFLFLSSALRAHVSIYSLRRKSIHSQELFCNHLINYSLRLAKSVIFTILYRFSCFFRFNFYSMCTFVHRQKATFGFVE